MRLVAGLCPDPLGELYIVLPQTPSWIKEGKERGKREGEKRREPEDPQCLKCVDAHDLNCVTLAQSNELYSL